MNKKGKYSPEFKEQAVKRTLSGVITSYSIHYTKLYESNRM
ncbi:hypothetical protein LEP1GSC024_4016 [Leptospira noguchii str. 2001034031]|uniref:Transposase n=1 Tax=Leptospira noguchii str. 2001034031 TaxID=1193053 RepID=M6Y4E0_9LEPT|nr:hypothetical protein LEP1GSC024_4016 [Leptospira noguchii str. 2001034031]